MVKNVAYGQLLIPGYLKSMNRCLLKQQFYNTYAQMGQSLNDPLKQLGFQNEPIVQLLNDELQISLRSNHLNES